MPLKDDLEELAKLPRTRKSLEKIQEQVTELREFADSAADALSALQSARESAAELEATLDTDDNPVLPWAMSIREVVQVFLAELPEETDDDLDDLITDAEGYAEEYENCLEDKDYTKDDREEAWGFLLDALENIAGALQ